MIIEFFTMGFLVFWFGIGALIAMIVSFFTNNIFIQTSVFLVASVILLFATKPFVKRFSSKTIPTNANSLIGKTGLVVQEIDNIKSVGQVKVNGELWSAVSLNNVIIAKDTQVEIVEINGVKLAVKQIN